jgi:lysophospholipase L1-like esterase
MKLFKYYLLFICISCSINIFAQPFADEIQEFKKMDGANPPPANAILFVGSSSFRKWTDVSSYFPGYIIINRGFGGSTLPDVIRYANDIIIPYHPKQVVIYCGENDFEGADHPGADTVFERFKTLFELIRHDLPGENIAFISMKPSPSRMKHFSEFEKANLLIQTYLSLQSHAAFIDVYHKMLKADGSVMKELFLEDMLHMNAKGYAIWQKAITPYLSK